MGFKNFVKSASKDKILFFQSSYPYLHNNGLSPFQKFFNKKWKFDDPHATSSQFLCIDTGHYGLYYTVFNHDADRKTLGPAQNYMNFEYIANYRDQEHTIVYFPYLGNFYISEAKKDILNDINYIKSVTKEFLSTLSYVKPRLRNVNQRRYFSTKPYNQPKQGIEESVVRDEQIIKDNNEKTFEVKLESFEGSFLNTQIRNIKYIYLNSKSRDDLNMIYPIYQSLKRNEIQLPDIDLYNIVLESIVKRSLDNDKVDIESVESRLTTLMTVYQDLLNANIKPNKATYDIILKSLFSGSLEVLEFTTRIDCPPNVYMESLSKCEQFSSLGIELFMSIKNIEELNLTDILPALFTILNNYPKLLKKDILEKLYSLSSLQVNNHGFYSGIIGLSFYLRQFNILVSNKETYDFITSVYENFKSACLNNSELATHQYVIYKDLIQSLIQNGNFPLATKFLDEIIIDYKSVLTSSLKPTKKEISELISSYLAAMLSYKPISNSLESSYDLLLKFNSISYIPEMSVSLYNNMINSFIMEYQILERQLSDQNIDVNVIKAKQSSYYNIIWKLYNYVSIRKDFQGNSFTISSQMGAGKIFCRDSILSFSIDLGDSEKVFQLLKEILMKNHLIKDPNTLGKLSYYLYYGSISNGLNTQYFELLWNVIEEQSKYYDGSTKNLSNFIADYLKYLIIGNDEYNIKLLTNSLMIKKCFETFDLQEDNLYVVFSVTKSLIDYASYFNIESKDVLYKILQYESHVLNELENTENHYIDLGDDWNQFKSSLKSNFIYLIEKSTEFSDFSYSVEMKNVCELLDIKMINSNNFGQISNSHYSMNLSHLLNTNYKLGVKKFIELFNEGYTFDKKTWQILINSNLILDATTKLIKIDIYEFVKRLFESDFEAEAKEEFLVSLIQMKVDKANIQIAKFLIENDLKFQNDSVYLNMVESLDTSDNIYLKELFSNNFYKIYQDNQSFSWITPLLKILENDANYERILNTTMKMKLELDLSQPLEVEALSIILKSYINQNKQTEFDTLFKFYFKSSKDLNSILLKSNKLSAVLMKYYNLRGDFDLVLSKFKTFSENSKETRHEYYFAKYMKYLIQNKSYPIEEATLLQEISFALIGNDFENMNKIFLKHSYIIKNQLNDLVEMTLSNLIRIGSTKIVSNINQISLNKFQNFVKFLMLIKCKEISVENLVKIINFLTISQSKENLNVLLNKLIFENEGSRILNYYFLEVKIFTINKRLKVLRAMNNAFSKLKDNHSVAILKQYAKIHNLDIN